MILSVLSSELSQNSALLSEAIAKMYSPGKEQAEMIRANLANTAGVPKPSHQRQVWLQNVILIKQGSMCFIS